MRAHLLVPLLLATGCARPAQPEVGPEPAPSSPQPATGVADPVAPAPGHEPGPGHEPAPGHETVPAPAITLTGGSPRVEFPCSLADARAGLESGLLTLEVLSIERPTPTNFELCIGALWRDGLGPHQAEFGCATPFPADRPGRFTLRPPDSLQELLAFDLPEFRGFVELIPLNDMTLPSDLSVVVAQPVWRAAD